MSAKKSKKARSTTPGTALLPESVTTGIGAPGRHKGIGWDAIRELGVVPDKVLAQQLGCTAQNVAQARRSRGIPACEVQAMRFEVLAARWRIARIYTQVLSWSDEGGAL